MDNVLITNVLIAIVIYNIFTQVFYLICKSLNKFFTKLIFKRKLKKELDHIDVNGGEVSD